MRKAVLVMVALALVSLPVLAGTYLMNDTGQTAYGLRVTFSELVRITSFGDALTMVEPTGEATEFTFTGGGVVPSGGEWLNCEPSSASLLGYEWYTSSVAIELPEGSGEIPRPETYLYVPKIAFTQAEHHCLDCKTFAIVAVMRYYGEHVTFEDICREVGEPPGAVYEDIAFFRRLIGFARSRGFVVENHFWSVDQIVTQLAMGRPVIASHRFGDLPAEPGIVKGYDGTHVWVWGIQEFIQQRSKDSLYTYSQFQTLLEKRNSGTGMMGYVPELFASASNCLLVYRPGVGVTAPAYEIEAIPFSERIQSTYDTNPGAVRALSLVREGEMRWSGKFRVGQDKVIEVLVYNSEYVVSSAQGPTVTFAVRLLPGSQDAGGVIQGYDGEEKVIWSSPLGHVFEEVPLRVVREESAWIGHVVVRPVRTLEQLIVVWPFASENRPFFGYKIAIEE